MVTYLELTPLICSIKPQAAFDKKNKTMIWIQKKKIYNEVDYKILLKASVERSIRLLNQTEAQELLLTTKIDIIIVQTIA